jgi:hypothetical protein
MRKIMIGLVALVAATAANAAPLTPVSISGTGTFNNSPSLIINGAFPPRNTFWQDPTNVWWTGAASAAFTIDYGTTYNITSLIADLDNNDGYRVQYSTNGVTFTNLFDFLASDGPVAPAPGGMDILTTDPTFPFNPGNATTPAFVGRTFAPVQARYLRITGFNGDDLFAVGELQAFGTAVPEPISIAVFGGLVVVGGLVARRRRMA